MSDPLRQLLRGTLERFNLYMMSCDRFRRIEKQIETQSEQLKRTNSAIDLILQLPEEHSAKLLRSARESKSQLLQDLFVLSELGFKREGFFVEFGATNGIDLSNTFLLEKQFAWTGILAEPAKAWQAALRKNRACNVESACVWRETGASVTFNAADMGELGTIDAFSSSDHHAQRRGAGEKYEVPTISLADLLEKFNAPREIDYLSVDTEGSEFEILRDFDFNKYRFKVITVEHNFTPQREDLFTLLTRNGYTRKCEGASEFDDWYVVNETSAQE
jgi:FkbM family methyltransferase